MLTHGFAKPTLPERVIVIGANGFLGTHLLRGLAQKKVETLAINSRNCDLTAQNAARELASRLRPTDTVVMLAAVKPGRQHDEEAFLENTTMGLVVGKAIREAGCAHLVYISSDAVYSYASSPVNESIVPQPTSLYALMHLAREKMLGRSDGPPFAILRLTQVYGFGDTHNAYGPGLMVRSALTDRRIVVFGTGQETRDHIYVDDVASVLFDVIAMRSRGVINIATGRSISFISLAELVRGICGNDVKIEYAPPRMPVLHRSFDVSAFINSFPSRQLTSLDTGIAALVRDTSRISTFV